MKIWFNTHGYRETKTWSCSNCNSFHVCGMDLFVDESIENHKSKCFSNRLKGKIQILIQKWNDMADFRPNDAWESALKQRLQECAEELNKTINS
jgi:hypothetical protein